MEVPMHPLANIDFLIRTLRPIDSLSQPVVWAQEDGHRDKVIHTSVRTMIMVLLQSSTEAKLISGRGGLTLVSCLAMDSTQG